MSAVHTEWLFTEADKALEARTASLNTEIEGLITGADDMRALARVKAAEVGRLNAQRSPAVVRAMEAARGLA